MKAIIEMSDDDNLSCISFSKKDKEVGWGELSRREQDRTIEAMFHYSQQYAMWRNE
jgi:hypothetical protein